MNRCRVCSTPLPPPGPLGGRPRRRCDPCARWADALRVQRARRKERARRIDGLTPEEWDLLHLTPEFAAEVARDGLVVADDGPDPDEEDAR